MLNSLTLPDHLDKRRTALGRCYALLLALAERAGSDDHTQNEESDQNQDTAPAAVGDEL